MKAFERKANGTLTGMRYSTLSIRLGLSIYLKSAAAYNVLRGSGVMTLPCPRLLQSYVAFSTADAGVNANVFDRLQRQWTAHTTQTNGPPPLPAGILVFDELKVKSGLVWTPDNKLRGYALTNDDLIGMGDLFSAKATDGNKPTREKTSYISQVQWKCLSSALILSGPYFTVGSQMTAETLFSALTMTFDGFSSLGLHVIGICMDGETKNLKCMKMWVDCMRGMTPLAVLAEEISRKSTVNQSTLVDKYALKAWNPFAQTYTYLLIDPSHSLKNARNALFHSRKEGTTSLQRRGKPITWEHVRELFAKEQKTKDNPTYTHLIATRLTWDSVELTNWTKMR
jgi:hypothetical protein